MEARDKKGSYGYRKAELGKRLRRIEGQVRGVARMVDDEKYCVDILTQVAAIRAALGRVSLEVLRDHVNGCVSQSLQSKDGEERVRELVDVLERFVALKQ